MTEETFEYARRKGSASKIGQLNALGRYAVAEGTQFTFHLVDGNQCLLQKLQM
jgi:hypothetical protein